MLAITNRRATLVGEGAPAGTLPGGTDKLSTETDGVVVKTGTPADVDADADADVIGLVAWPS